MTEPKAHHIEGFNTVVDYFKHLTTLSTGAIVIIATFLEKLFTKPVWKIAVIISLMGFMLSVISSVVAHTLWMLFEHPNYTAASPNWVSSIGSLVLFTTWIGFLLGIVSLAVFALKNFLQ